MQVDKGGEKGYYIVTMNDAVLLSTDIFNFNNSDLSGGCAVAVGNFDGVHVGHRRMLERLKSEATRLNLPSVVYTFDAYDSPKKGSKLLTLPDRKHALLREAGIDAVYSVKFSAIKDMTACDFAEKILYTALGAKSIVCGYDFRFGRDRLGDVALLKRLLCEKGVAVSSIDAERVENRPVSSTLIRTLIADGDIKQANSLLGSVFSFSAEVVKGRQLGRRIGFPTINQIYPDRLALPRFGVYAVKVTIDGNVFDGVANIGTKPTVSDEKTPCCETHILDFSGDCYGKTAEIEFVDFIRDEQRFDSVETLTAQIAKDIETISKGAQI